MLDLLDAAAADERAGNPYDSSNAIVCRHTLGSLHGYIAAIARLVTDPAPIDSAPTDVPDHQYVRRDWPDSAGV